MIAFHCLRCIDSVVRQTRVGAARQTLKSPAHCPPLERQGQHRRQNAEFQRCKTNSQRSSSLTRNASSRAVPKSLVLTARVERRTRRERILRKQSRWFLSTAANRAFTVCRPTSSVTRSSCHEARRSSATLAQAWLLSQAGRCVPFALVESKNTGGRSRTSPNRDPEITDRKICRRLSVPTIGS